MEESTITRNNLLCVMIIVAIATGIVAGVFSSLGLLDTQFVLVVPLALGLALISLTLTYALILSTRKQFFEFASPLEGKSYDPGEGKSEAFYKIPLYCPHCKDRIDLERTHYLDNETLVCQNCMEKVKVEITKGEDY